MQMRPIATVLAPVGLLSASLLATSARAQEPEAAPACVHNGPYLAECAGQATSVPVTSAGSVDPDGTAISVLWFEECPWGFFDDPTALDANLVIDIGGQCVRTCVFALRVFSGGQQVACVSNATIQDTTAPVITGPADITDIWGIPVDIGSTGFATAVDACDPAPVVSLFSEVITPQTPGSSIEQVITRVFEAEDYCGFTSQVTQVITLLSPSSGLATLEVDINQCDDVFDRSDLSASFDVVLLGRPGTQISGIKRDSLRLSRLGAQGRSLAPANPWQFAPLDVSVRAAAHLGECNPPGSDGSKDLRLRFNRVQARALLGVDALPAGSVIYLAISGKRTNNTPFTAGAKVVVQ